LKTQAHFHHIAGLIRKTSEAIIACG